MKKSIHFVKMHGAGNDFILVDNRLGDFPLTTRSEIAAFAKRPSGIGCEGVILVEKSETADFRMRFYNPDGSEAEMCGNGARCVAAFALEIGAAKEPKMRFETAAGEVAAQVLSPHEVRIGMPPPHGLKGNFIVAGVPHQIVEETDLAAVDVDAEGRRIRNSAAFAPNGTNVDFVCWEDSHKVKLRTYERGVEAESFACGTGAVATALVGVANGRGTFPVEVRTFRGEKLIVDGERCADGSFVNVTLTGPVQRVFEGNWELA